MKFVKSTSQLSFTKNISYKAIAFLLFFSLQSSYTFAQSGCCVAINENDFQSYCIANVDPCTAGTTCNAAALDAAYGISGLWSFGFQCATPADCSTQGCNALPVELIGFDISMEENGILLEWATASELNNEGFIVERSNDGENWLELHFVKGNGTSLEPHGYDYLDDSPRLGFNYYRLKQVDFDGQSEHSVVKVTVWQGSDDFNKLQLAVLPNPTTDWITVALPSGMTLKKNMEFNIFDQAGRLVHTHFRGKEEEIRISLDGLPSGYYIINVRQEGVQHSAPFIKR